MIGLYGGTQQKFAGVWLGGRGHTPLTTPLASLQGCGLLSRLRRAAPRRAAPRAHARSAASPRCVCSTCFGAWWAVPAMAEELEGEGGQWYASLTNGLKPLVAPPPIGTKSGTKSGIVVRA